MIENFGKNMSRLRKEKGMNQEELAAKLGVSKQTISTIEKGDSFPTFKNLEKISKILNASPIQLFGTQKEIAVSDTPMILSKIDEYDNKIQNILRAEKILEEEDTINYLIDKLNDLHYAFLSNPKKDDNGSYILNENNEIIYENSFLDYIISEGERIDHILNNLNDLSSFFTKNARTYDDGTPIFDKNNQITYDDSDFDFFAKKEEDLDRIIEKIKFINEHNKDLNK